MAKKFLLALFLLIAIFLGYLLSKYLYELNQEILLTSSHKTYKLAKSEDYSEFSKYLSYINFWGENNVATTTGADRTTAKKLVIEITDTPQNVSFVKNNLEDNEFLSSASYVEDEGTVKISVHIDENLCTLPECSTTRIINRQIVNMLYQATHRNNLNGEIEETKEFQLNYFELQKKIGLTIVGYANAQSCSWQCRPQTCNSDGSSCICGPAAGFTEEGPCGTGCPPGYCTSGGCSGCGADSGGGCPGGYDKNGNCKTGGGGNDCFNAAVNCPAGTEITTTKASSPARFCSRKSEPVIQNLCSVGSAQKDTGICCASRCIPNDDCRITPSGKEVCGCDEICNGNYIDTYTCAPICSPVAPTAPTLSSPADGATVTSETSSTTLTWNPTASFGTACSNASNQYRVYVGTGNPPTNWVGTTSSTSYQFTGAPGTNTYYWFVQAHNGQLFANSEIRSFTLTSVLDAWWQVKDADISSSGDLISGLPSGFEFNEEGDGGYPGVPVYGGASASFSYDGSEGVVSSRGWIVNSSSNLNKIYDTNFFKNLIPDDTVVTSIPTDNIPGSTFESGGTLSHGYYWYRYDGSSSGLDLNITSSANLGSRKVILIVDSADLLVNGQINLTKGQGFFLALVGKNTANQKGNIRIGTSIGGGATPHLEGLYLADNTIYTGEADDQLYVRGSLVGYGGISLQRDLNTLNNTTPAEYFEYAPDQVMLFPSKIGARRISWKEVAP